MRTRNWIIVCLFILGCSSSFAATRILYAPSYNSALQALVNQSSFGDTIIIKSGDHYITNPIVFPVGKDGITIQGENGAILRKAPMNPAVAGFEIWGNWNTINNIDLDGGMLGQPGIIIYGALNAITNSKIHNCGGPAGVGIMIHNSGNPVAAYNLIQGCQIYYNDHVGISQSGHIGGEIRDCVIYENGAEGITVDNGSHDNLVYNCWLSHNNVLNGGCGGIGVDQANNNEFILVTVTNTFYRSGLTFNNEVGGCDSNVIVYCAFTNNAQWGILSEENPFHTTNTAFGWLTFSGNGRQPNIFFRQN